MAVNLTSPSGTAINLFAGVGGDGDDFTETQLDDEASTSINDGSAPFTGSFIPNELLSAFDGENTMGTWTLSITDNASNDEGTLNSWSILVDSQPATVGSIRLDKNAYNPAETILIDVIDGNADEPVMVQLETTSGDVETVML